jgi:hypothetical protein
VKETAVKSLQLKLTGFRKKVAERKSPDGQLNAAVVESVLIRARRFASFSVGELGRAPLLQDAL